MNNAEAVNWLINITADIGKVEHQDLWHYEQALSEIREMLENMPTIEPQRWIPVTERLPEHSGFYIVTAIVTDDGGKLVGLRWFSQEHGWKFGKNPLAWMPLPEPYTSGADMRETE